MTQASSLRFVGVPRRREDMTSHSLAVGFVTVLWAQIYLCTTEARDIHGQPGPIHIQPGTQITSSLSSPHRNKEALQAASHTLRPPSVSATTRILHSKIHRQRSYFPRLRAITSQKIHTRKGARLVGAASFYGRE